jgi:hypothetical protein
MPQNVGPVPRRLPFRLFIAIGNQPEFGDGIITAINFKIISAINFKLDVKKVADPDGARRRRRAHS